MAGVYVAADGTLLKGAGLEINDPSPDGVSCGMVKPENDGGICIPVFGFVDGVPIDIGSGWLETVGTCSGNEGLGTDIVGGANILATDGGGAGVVNCRAFDCGAEAGVDNLPI